MAAAAMAVEEMALAAMAMAAAAKAPDWRVITGRAGLVGGWPFGSLRGD